MTSANYGEFNSYYAITGNNDAIFVGGWTKDDDLIGSSIPDYATVVTRIDLSTLTVVWMMLYTGDDGDMRKVNGLALSPDGSKFAVSGA